MNDPKREDGRSSRGHVVVKKVLHNFKKYFNRIENLSIHPIYLSIFIVFKCIKHTIDSLI